jgi:hypothetical protein
MNGWQMEVVLLRYYLRRDSTIDNGESTAYSSGISTICNKAMCITLPMVGDAKMSLIMMNVGNGYKSVYDLQYEYESRVRYGSAVFLSKNERE